MIIGIVLSIIAGSLVGLQNIFNSKVNEHTGSWTTTTIVLGMGFLASFTIGFIAEGKQLFSLENMQVWYWFSGLIGVGVVTCVTKGVRLLGPTYAISIVLISQLAFALLLDSMGWMGLEKVPFTSKQLVGVLILAGGVFLFKFGGNGAFIFAKKRTEQSE
ncbi:DMT family transporter [Niallia sp. NCCP-28]|uniref:DMT family transporter n=1 Tax=Niallia sp. NCCP-28 TaxID=2934712 RepID=UPI002085B750|nr:DMT family transporter [Niallia sp. NCCP-28]GKU84613.1 membrane protein [Niallia sp. NCCP-28]